MIALVEMLDVSKSAWDGNGTWLTRCDFGRQVFAGDNTLRDDASGDVACVVNVSSCIDKVDYIRPVVGCRMRSC